jgi:uncharacterized protein (DUF169 family)
MRKFPAKRVQKVSDFRQLRTASYTVGRLLSEHCPEGHRAVGIKLLYADSKGRVKEVLLKIPGVDITEHTEEGFEGVPGLSDMSYSECTYCPMDYVGE